MASLTLYGPTLSTYVRTVRLLLEEVNAEYDLESIDILSGESKSAEYRLKHPFGKVPTLDVDGDLLYETAAITDYLNATVAGGQFLPSDPMLAARMRQIICIIDSYLYTPAIQTIVIQRLIVPSQGGTPDEAKISASVEPVKTALDAIEAIASCSPYLLGDEITLADFHLIPIFVYLSKTPEFETTTSDTPKLKTWWNAVSDRATVQKVCS